MSKPDIKQCLNGCGPLVFLEKAAWVLIDFEVLNVLPEDLKSRVTVATLILAVCPKCGYHISPET